MTTPYVMSPWAWARLRERLEWAAGADTGWDLGPGDARRAFVHRWTDPATGQWDDDALAVAFAAYGWALHVGGHGATATPLGEPWGDNGDTPRCPCGAALRTPEGSTLTVRNTDGTLAEWSHPSGVGVCRPCATVTHRRGDISGPSSGCGWTDDARTVWRCNM